MTLLDVVSEGVASCPGILRNCLTTVLRGRTWMCLGQWKIHCLCCLSLQGPANMAG